MDEGCEPLPGTPEHGHGTLGVAVGIDRVSVGIDVPPVVGEPEGDFERGVA